MLKPLSDEAINKIELTEEELDYCHEMATVGVLPNEQDVYDSHFKWSTESMLKKKAAQASQIDTAGQIADHFMKLLKHTPARGLSFRREVGLYVAKLRELAEEKK